MCMYDGNTSSNTQSMQNATIPTTHTHTHTTPTTVLTTHNTHSTHTLADTTSARRMFHQATQLGTSAQSLANWAALALAQQAAVLRRGGGGVEGGRGEGVRGVGGGDSQKTTGAPGTPSTHHPLAASQWEEQEVDMAEVCIVPIVLCVL